MPLTCKEFSRLVASGERTDLLPWRKLEVGIHGWLCRHCRRYRKQIGCLGAAARRAWARGSTDAARTDALAGRIMESLDAFEAGAHPDLDDRAGPEP